MRYSTFFFPQIQELRCLQANQNKLRHSDSFLKAVWWLIPWHVPQTQALCKLCILYTLRLSRVQQHYRYDTATGTNSTKGKVINREMTIDAARK